MNEQPRDHKILHSQYSRYDKRRICRETDVAFKRNRQEISQRINATPLIHSDMVSHGKALLTLGMELLTGMAQFQEERG